MTLALIPYPEIDPVLVQIGPFAIRWYALAYIAGLVIGWQIMRRVCTQPPRVLTPTKIDDFLLWAALGVILGGRLGYVLFYKPAFFLQNPLQIFTLWEGGMSFHGGLLGVILAILLFALRNGVSPFMLSDLVAIVTPIEAHRRKSSILPGVSSFGGCSQTRRMMRQPITSPEI